MFFPTAQPEFNKGTSLPAPTYFDFSAKSDVQLSIPVPEKSRSRVMSGDNSDEANSDASTDAGVSPKNDLNSKAAPRKEFVKEFKRK